MAQLQGCSKLANVHSQIKQVPVGTTPWNLIALPSPVLCLKPSDSDAEKLALQLQDRTQPIIGRVADGHVELVLRTIAPAEDQQIVDAFWPTEESSSVSP